jgi:hypothetical protein
MKGGEGEEGGNREGVVVYPLFQCQANAATG